jgi:opacity protein-like surface antigen
MKITMVAAGLFLVMSTSSALAAGPYVGASGGVSIFHDSDLNSPGAPTIKASYDTGFGFNLNGGYNFDGFRVEGEFGYKNADIDKVSIPGASATVTGADSTVMSYMANGYFDFKNSTQVTPFIGAGIGLLHGEIDDNGFKTTDNAFGYQFMAGVGFNLNKNVTLELSYRFQGAASDFEDNADRFSYMSSNITGGIRYNF